MGPHRIHLHLRYENYPTLVGPDAATSPDPVTRFRWLLLQAVCGTGVMQMEQELLLQARRRVCLPCGVGLSWR
jgi:hypothetical protein